jgi:hypothetical protein
VRRLRAVLAIALGACSSPAWPGPADAFVAAECFPARTSACQVLVAIPQLGIPILWPCGTGIGHPEIGKPDHRPCVVCSPRQPKWCEAGTGACVDDCATCTPAIVLRLDQFARCKPEDETWPASWAPADMAGQPISAP